jgi:aryl-alcohol dehydrogenase-like predicted oxidoreductase
MGEWGEDAGDSVLDWLSDGDPAELIRRGYQFAAEPEAVTTVISGTSSIAHLEANVAAVNGTLPDESLARLKLAYGDSDSPD